MIEIFHMPGRLADAAWGDIAPLIAPAVDMAEGRHTLSTTLERVRDGHMQAFLGLKDARPVMACITQVASYPAQRWLQVPFCGGSGLWGWIGPLVEAVDEMAYNAQCVGVEISGRGGWVRVLRKYGYKPSANHSLLIRRLDWQRARKVA